MITLLLDKLLPAIPLNRIVAFLGPKLAVLEGLAASWLVLNVHVFGALGIHGDAVASVIAWVGITGIVAGLNWLGKSKWLTGHIALETTIKQVEGQLTALKPTLPAGLGNVLGQAPLPARLKPVEMPLGQAPPPPVDPPQTGG